MTQPHIDLAALAELKDVMGDEFALLVTTFVDDSVIRIEAIADAIAQANPEAIRRAAHSFKGSAGNMGATHLTELCRSLEEMGHIGETIGAQELFEMIKTEYSKVQVELTAL
jgi:HPt (histidine-containing phosphotransfer) domain-containing protein